MAISYKPTEAVIIAPEMNRAFMEKLSSNQCTKEYWDECAKSKTITPEAMKYLKEKR